MKKLFLFMLLLAAAVLPGWAEKYPDALYVVGDATSYGWPNPPTDAPKLTKTSDKVYEGFINFVKTDGEFKFLVTNLYNQGQWSASTSDESITSTEANLSYESVGDGSSGHPDYKFIKFNLELGLYLVTVDLTTDGSETVTFTKWNSSDTYTINSSAMLSIYVEGHNKVDNSIKFSVSTDISADNNIVYEISNASDLQNFSSLVNNGAGSLNGMLTTNIDMDGVTGWTPIGQDGKDFKGHFDGQGNRILNLTTSNGYNNQALFGQAVGGAIIENVIIDASCTIQGAKWAAGILGHVWGDGVIVRNCGNEANVIGTGETCAGIVGCSEKEVYISNCYNTGNITGEKWNAGICGWMGSGSSTITNCYSIGSVSGGEGNLPIYRRDLDEGNAVNNYTTHDGQGTKVTSTQVSSGELCYKLNGSADDGTTWTQTIGTDSHPIPFATRQSVRHASTGAYTNLGVGDGSVQLGTASDMAKFSAEVGAGNTTANAVLTADIDMSSGGYSPIGTTDNKYAGTFDGQGHTVTLNISANTGYQGLIGCATGGAVIQNVITRGSVSGSAYCGGILGGALGSGAISITNCGNEASITTAGVNAGGVLGCNAGDLTCTLKNCYNTGTISGSNECAGLSAWLGSNAVVTNCYNAGTVTGVDGSNRTFARWNSGTYTNCYNTLSAGTYAGRTDNYPMEKVRSGELCAALGSPFTQDLSQEGHPTFGSKTVTAGKWFNDSDNDVYYNEEDGNYTVWQLSLDDSKAVYNVPANVTAKNVTMTRTLHELTADGSASRWNTFCSPVALAKSNFSAIKKLTDATKTGDNYTMTFGDENEGGDYIVAGRPYMVQVSEGKTELTATDVAVAAASTSTASDTFSGLTFNGNFTSGNAPTGSFIISNNVFYNVDSTVELKAFRGYITVDGAKVKALTFDFDDDASGLKDFKDLKDFRDSEDAIFNLAGQRLSRMQKGINIVGGKKILK